MKYINQGKMCSIPEPDMENLEQRISRLEAEREIKEILFHYTRCVDMGDAEGVASCYTEDGCFYPSDFLSGIQGKDRIFRLFSRLLEPQVLTSAHYICNQQVCFLSQSEALVYACFRSNKSFSDGRDDENCWGGYELRVVIDKDGQWRIKSHKCFMSRQTGCENGRRREQLDRPWPPLPEYRS